MSESKGYHLSTEDKHRVEISEKYKLFIVIQFESKHMFSVADKQVL